MEYRSHSMITSFGDSLVATVYKFVQYFPFSAPPVFPALLTCTHLPRHIPTEPGTRLLLAGEAGGEEKMP